MRKIIILLLLLMFSTNANAFIKFPDWMFGQTVSLHGGGASGHSDFHMSYVFNITILGAGFDLGTANGESYYSNYFVPKLRLFAPIYEENMFIFYEPGLMIHNGIDDGDKINGVAMSNKIGFDFMDDDTEWVVSASVRFAQNYRTSMFIGIGRFF